MHLTPFPSESYHHHPNKYIYINTNIRRVYHFYHWDKYTSLFRRTFYICLYFYTGYPEDRTPILKWKRIWLTGRTCIGRVWVRVNGRVWVKVRLSCRLGYRTRHRSSDRVGKHGIVLVFWRLGVRYSGLDSCYILGTGRAWFGVSIRVCMRERVVWVGSG